MSQKIQSALTAEQWAEKRYVRGPDSMEDGFTWTQGDSVEIGVDRNRIEGNRVELTLGNRGVDDQADCYHPSDLAALIALANAALPDSNDRKLTAADVLLLRHLLALAAPNMQTTPRDTERAEAIIDALESYLPPQP